MSNPPKFGFGSASNASPFGAASSSSGSTPSLTSTSGAGGAFSGFGNSTGNNTSSSASTPSLFASFGGSSAPIASATAAPSAPTFSWGAPPTSTGALSSNATTTAPSLFGSITPTAPKIGGFSFSSTTPAGEPPKETAQGTSTGAGTTSGSAAGVNPFSGGKTLFNQQSNIPPSSQSAPVLDGQTQSTAQSSNIFGGQTPSTAQNRNLFGGLGQDKSQSSNLFSGLGQANTSATPANPATTTTSPAPTFSFNNTQPTTTTSTTSSLFSPSVGATPAVSQDGQKSLFSFPGSGGASEKPTSTGPAAQNTPTFSFLKPSSDKASAPEPAASPFSGFKPGGSASASPATTSAPTFSFPSASTSASQAASTTAAASPFLSSASATAPTLSSQPATTAPAPSPLSIGGTSTSAAQQGMTATKTSSSVAPPQTGAPSGLTASTTGPVPLSQSRLKNKTMDEILTRWATDLTTYTKDFRTAAETVSIWDQHLVENMSKISKLYSQTLTAERQTESVEMQLSAVENQQAELESWLSVYERQVDEMLEREGKGQGEIGGPDSERERTYRLSEKLGERLEEMATDLEGMVGEINAANSALSRNGKQHEPITQIVRILNSHLTQLKAIDDGAAALNAKIERVQKSLGSLAYSNDGMNGNGTAAVDDFYKSYLGRRG